MELRPTGVGIAEEEPVFLSDSRGANRVFDVVVVYLDDRADSI